jgi:Flp pilus assembly protein TadG
MDKLMKLPKKFRARNHKSERGQSLVELAISFMVIAFLLSGAVDFGRAYFVLIALRDAAQEGAIYASMNPHDHSGVLARIQDSSSGPVDFANDPNLSFVVETEGAGGASVYCSGFYDEGGDIKANAVKVTVKYEFPITMALIQAMVPGNAITLGASSTYSILYPPC